jgi:hypothetical protein
MPVVNGVDDQDSQAREMPYIEINKIMIASFKDECQVVNILSQAYQGWQ